MTEKSEAEIKSDLAYEAAKKAMIANVNVLLKENYAILPILFNDKKLKDFPTTEPEKTKFDEEINRMAKEAISGSGTDMAGRPRGFYAPSANGKEFISLHELGNKLKSNDQFKIILAANNAENFEQLVPDEDKIDRIAGAIRDAVKEEMSGTKWATNATFGWVKGLTGDQDNDLEVAEFAQSIQKNAVKKLSNLAAKNLPLQKMLTPNRIKTIGEDLYESITNPETENSDKEQKNSDIYKINLSKITVKDLSKDDQETIREIARTSIYNDVVIRSENAIQQGVADEIKNLEKGDFLDKVKAFFFDIFNALGLDWFKPKPDDISAAANQIATTISTTLTSADFDPQIIKDEEKEPEKHNELSELIRQKVLEDLKNNKKDYSYFDDKDLEKIAKTAGLAVEETSNVQRISNDIPNQIYNKKSAPAK